MATFIPRIYPIALIIFSLLQWKTYKNMGYCRTTLFMALPLLWLIVWFLNTVIELTISIGDIVRF